ncbi:MAG: hypothetical protein ISEC1_P0386 [Thiomicrorhabdus sp.]|nr:MAG: hypothetical protein ISEC1_P0386 [Thiomicrorhabdus sp.]
MSISKLNLPLSGLMASALIIGVLSPITSVADETLPNFTDAFRSPDQQAYKAFQNNQLESAENLFENPLWRATTLYRLGKYKESAELYGLDKSPTGDYNRGNALAKSGQLAEAKSAYTDALNKQPDMLSAQKNLNIINRLLKQEEQKQQQKQDGKEPSEENSEEQSGKPSDDQNKQGEQQSQDSESSESESEEQKSSDDSSEKSSDQQQSSEQGDSGLKDEPVESTDKAQPPEENQNGSAEPETIDQQETSQSSENENDKQDKDNAGKLADDQTLEKAKNSPEASISQKHQEQQQATQNWLKQIPDEPGLFLKRKFQYQFQQEPNQSAQGDGNKKQW